MRTIRGALLFFLVGSTVFAQRSPEPVLRSAQLPEYPHIAVLARIEGEVKASFVLNRDGEVVSVETLSGHGLLRRATEENIRTWKFFIPAAARQPELKLTTTFRYHFSGRKIVINQTGRLTVTVDSFHKIEVVTDEFIPNLD